MLRIFPSRLSSIFDGLATESDILFEKSLLKPAKDQVLLRKPKSVVPTLRNKNSPETRAKLAKLSTDLTRNSLSSSLSPTLKEFNEKKMNWSMYRWNTSESEVIRTRILDIDKLSIEEMNGYFAYSLSKHLPNEISLKLLKRISLYRDKHTNQSYHNMMNFAIKLFDQFHAPELAAFFARSHSTISVAFALDYIRRFGTFSRKYLASEIDKTNKPKFFDAIRYPGGVRPIPPILTNPYELWTYARYLPGSNAKRQLIQRLLAEKLKDPCYLTEGSRVDRALKTTELMEEKMILEDQRRNQDLINNQFDRIKLIEKTTKYSPPAVNKEFKQKDVQFIKVCDESAQQRQNISKSLEAVQNEDFEEPAGTEPVVPWWSRKLKKKFTFKNKVYKFQPGSGWKRIFRKIPDYSANRRMLLNLKGKDKQIQKIGRKKELFIKVLSAVRKHKISSET
jgi:hypothetical protein